MSTPENRERGQGGGSRWLLLAFIVSLSVNMLILGAIGAMIYTHRTGALPAWMQRMHAQQAQRLHGQGRGVAALKLARPGLLLASLRQLMRSLPEQRRAQLRPILKRHRQDIAAAHARVAQARQEVLRLLRRQPPADDAALRQAWERLRAAEMQARGRVLVMFDDFTRALTPAERARFARIVWKKVKARRLFRRF